MAKNYGLFGPAYFQKTIECCQPNEADAALAQAGGIPGATLLTGKTRENFEFQITYLIH
jgi:hypothetical protein